MKHNHVLIRAGALLVSATIFGGAWAGIASASSPKVSVRVEGLRRTLVADSTVQGKAGTFTRDGHAIKYDSALGALQLASAGKWQGSWDSEYAEWELTGILGEAHAFTSKYFWAIYVNHVQASTSADQVVLKAGQKIVFAVLPDTNYDEDLIGVSAAATATQGQTLEAKVVYYGASGVSHPLAGASVNLAGRVTKTNAAGIAKLTATSAGTDTITASKAGYVRDETTLAIRS